VATRWSAAAGRGLDQPVQERVDHQNGLPVGSLQEGLERSRGPLAEQDSGSAGSFVRLVAYHAERVVPDLEGFDFGLRELPVYYGNYMNVLKFTLVDEDDQTFRTRRWCFRGAIDDWIDLWSSGGDGKLTDLVKTFCPHVGKESLYELM
jgi:hypothetical protein